MKCKLWFWLFVPGWAGGTVWGWDEPQRVFPRRHIRKVSPRFDPRRNAKPDISNRPAQWWLWLHEFQQLRPERFPRGRANQPRVLATCSCLAASGRESRRGSSWDGAPTCSDWSGGPSLEMGNTPVWSSRSHGQKPSCVRTYSGPEETSTFKKQHIIFFS